jgi:ATP-dependent exoDNAse (exonuclease V) beta subunit
VTGSNLEDDGLACPEGQERCLRAQQEDLRLLYVGCTRAKDKLVFAHRPDKYQWLARQTQFDTILDHSLGDGEHALTGIDTTLVLRNLSADLVDDCKLPVATSERWLSLSLPPVLEPCEPRFHRPSGSAVSVLTDANYVHELTGPLQFSSAATQDRYGTIGSAVHSYFAALPSMSGFDDVRKVEVAERCLAGLLAFYCRRVTLFRPEIIFAVGLRRLIRARVGSPK